MNFNEYPDLWMSGLDFGDPKKLTTANPQQNDYNWGTVELIQWTSADGVELDGLLYKPENFDPGKKYPMVVYFYERYSDRLHSHNTPRPSRSTVNFTFYASNGYLVFVPDIVYKNGFPGQSAYNSIVSGTLKLIENPWVDAGRIGIQGQSWGGYQVAYLVTQTNMFAAAMAGAPVSNMTSAYGGIRWGSGMSRMFQYEGSQSRLGGTLWEKPWRYIENSPVFFADKVETPLLMMHNDEDGAVPWYLGIEYFVALRRLNKPVWMLTYNGAPHNLKRRADCKDLSIRMLQFFDHYLKDAPAPVWMEYGIQAVDKGKKMGYELIKD
jgi:dipeptidyl aminopeptidase/acylaminoacyl peptidase